MRPLTLAGRSVIRAGFALPRDAGRRPALQAVRAASSVGGTCRDGVIPPVGVGAAAALRAAVPTGGRRSLACRAISPSGVRAERGAMLAGWGFGRCGAARRCADRRSAFQAVPALLRDWRRAALTLAGGSVIGAGFALPRDAGRRPALQSSPRLFSVCGARYSRWQDGASSVLVSRSRAMPVGDRRSSRPCACSRSVVRGAHAGRMERHRSLFRAPARCRSETGAPGRPSCLICWGSAPRGEPS